MGQESRQSMQNTLSSSFNRAKSTVSDVLDFDKEEPEDFVSKAEYDKVVSELGEPRYDPDTGAPLNDSAEKLYEIEFERKEALGEEGYREDYGIGPEGIKEESILGDVDFGKISGLLKGGSNDVLRGTQISAPKPPSVSPRGGRIGVTYPYKSIAEGSYQQGVAYDDLVDKLVKGLLSEQIRQLPYRGLI